MRARAAGGLRGGEGRVRHARREPIASEDIQPRARKSSLVSTGTVFMPVYLKSVCTSSVRSDREVDRECREY